MSQKFLSTAAFAVSLSLIGLTAAQAAPAAPAAPVAAIQATSDVILVEGGCGPGWFRDVYGRCRRGAVVVPGAPVVVAPAAPVVVAPPVVAAPVVCGAGYRWHPRYRRCVVL
jgi:hypothetical protein